MSELQAVIGTVAQVNKTGLKLEEAGENGSWLNVSRYASPAPTMPERGAKVSLGLDGKGFIRTIEVLPSKANGNGHKVEPTPTVEPFPSPADASLPCTDRRISRLACLNTAVNILASGGRAIEDPSEVAHLAARLEKWVYRPVEQ